MHCTQTSAAEYHQALYVIHGGATRVELSVLSLTAWAFDSRRIYLYGGYIRCIRNELLPRCLDDRGNHLGGDSGYGI